MNKKVIGVFGVILVLILLIVISNISPREKLSNDPSVILSNAKYESENINDDEQKEFNEIGLEDFISILNNNKNQIVLIGREGCSYCKVAFPIIKNISYKYDLDINYLNVDKFNDEERETFLNSHEVFKEDFGTPLLLMIKNKEVVEKQDGLTDTIHYVKLLKDNGFIK